MLKGVGALIVAVNLWGAISTDRGTFATPPSVVARQAAVTNDLRLQGT
jgi:hypothetical protein